MKFIIGGTIIMTVFGILIAIISIITEE